MLLRLIIHAACKICKVVVNQLVKGRVDYLGIDKNLLYDIQGVISLGVCTLAHYALQTHEYFFQV